MQVFVQIFNTLMDEATFKRGQKSVVLTRCFKQLMINKNSSSVTPLFIDRANSAMSMILTAHVNFKQPSLLKIDKQVALAQMAQKFRQFEDVELRSEFEQLNQELELLQQQEQNLHRSNADNVQNSVLLQ